LPIEGEVTMIQMIVVMRRIQTRKSLKEHCQVWMLY